MNEQRFIDLEIKISHQEIAMESLQDLVYEQQKAIANLEMKLERLTQKLAEMAGAGPEIGSANEKPPHY